MKVITVGRNPQNDVVVQDPSVGRRHLQIVQHDDGHFSVVDLNSTNGTYINGRRIMGEAPLRPGDAIQIGRARLQWEQYFKIVTPIGTSQGDREGNTMGIVLGSLGGAIVLIATILLLFIGGSKPKNINYTGPQPPESVITLQEDGYEYHVHAFEGQLIVVFNEDVSHRKALKILKEHDVKVLSQFPESHYYLVEVPAGQESAYVSGFNAITDVDYVHPNAINVTDAVVSHVIDDLQKDEEGYVHGNMVALMMAGNDPVKMERVVKHDVHLSGSDRKINSQLKNEYILDVLRNLSDGESAVINLSISCALYDKEGNYYRVLWNSPNVGSSQQDDFVSSYVEDLLSLIKLVKSYDDKDFVIVKSSGNVGMKDMALILKKLEKKWRFGKKEQDVFKRHFILVSAKDDNKEADYPNDVQKGSTHEMVTKVDISDMTAQNLHWQGTSFSSPRVAGFIADIADKYDEQVVDVLQVVRNVTVSASNHIVTRDLLEAAMRKDTVETKPAHVVPSDNKSTDKGEEVNPKEESKPSVRPQTIYASLNHKEDFTLSDGSQGFVDLYSIGLGDLWLKIYWKGYSPIDLEWHLDGHGMEPASNKYTSEYYGTGGKYSYELYKEEYSFRWVSSDADVKGINVTITPR
jgi:hypothetical protein